MKIYLIKSSPVLNKNQKNKLDQLGDLSIIDAEKLSDNEVIEQAADAEIMIAGPSGIDKFSKDILQGLKKIKFVSLLTVGFAWVDLAAAKEADVSVSNIKGANSQSVAEHTWGMILDLGKRISEFDRDVREKGAYKFSNYKGKEIYGKTIGIIGLGDIGSKVAKVAKSFDMKVIGVNKSGRPVNGVELVDLSTLLAESDVIAVCAPLTPDTENMIDEEEIRQMKEGVILINTAREKIVNKNAVLKAVKSGKLFGYGIETEIMEPIPGDDPYLSHPRILITPHNAFNTEDAETKSFDLAIENIEAFIGGKPQNIVS